MYDFLWELNPDLVINNRAAGTEEAELEMGDYLSPEQWIPSEHMGKDWETCMTMNDSWGYKVNDHMWKSKTMLLYGLLDIVSKGGNLLLNVGPTADGLIPMESIEILKEIGSWLDVNGEAMYGTDAWTTQREGPTMVRVRNSYSDEEEAEDMVEIEYTPEDFLFTKKGKVIYAICLDWPEDGKILIKALGGDDSPDLKIKRVSLLGREEKLDWERGSGGLKVGLPVERPCEHAYVFKIE